MIRIFLAALLVPVLVTTPALCHAGAGQTNPSPTPTPPPPASSAPAKTPAHPMSKAERKQLLDAVDPMTEFVSKDSALPIHHPVKRRLIARSEVSKYLNSRMKDDESAKRLQRSSLVLKKFGLLPRDFDLGPFLISLLTEQIAGYYDTKTETINLLDWVPAEEQKPVLAHELTHALQDQSLIASGFDGHPANLEKWGDSGVHGVARTVADDREHVATDELEDSREAVAEGQAMVVYFDDAMRSSGRTLADVPITTSLLDSEATDDTKSSPVLAKAPLVLRESLLFPYSAGLHFEHVLLLRRGKPGAFASVLQHPPSTSYEVLNPDRFLAHTPVPSLTLPDVHPLLDPDFEPYDVGALGELDTRIFAEVLGATNDADRFASAWLGGAYYAAQRRSASPAEKATTGSLVLLYQSRWRSASAARAFAALYTTGLHHRFPSVTRRPADELPELSSSPSTSPTTSQDTAEQIYTTPEGDAVLFRSGANLLIAEGLPLPLARQLRPLFTTLDASGPIQQAATAPASPSLTAPLRHLLHTTPATLRSVSPSLLSQ